MELSKLMTNDFFMKLVVVIIVLAIVYNLGIFKKMKKTKPLTKLFFSGIMLFMLYMLYSVPLINRESFGNPKSCTYYYMNKCGHCERFTPEWDKFVQSYNGPVKMRKVEMSDAGSDLETYKIKGFPTVLIIDENGETKNYDGPRTSEGLKKFFES